MPRRGAAALLLTTAALALLLAFKTPSDPVAPGDTGGAAADGATPSPVAAARPGATSVPATAAPGSTSAPVATPAPVAGATPTPAPAAGATYRDGTVTGAAVGTRWGLVQVRVTIAGGVIADVTALQLPDGDRHSSQLSQRAEPQLRSSALAAQGANVDIVSGATYTSMAYAQSLQAALDSARA